MLILISGATRTVEKYKHHPNIGQLITPQATNRVRGDMPWAADNSAYSNWSREKFFTMLDKIKGTSPLFVACPDVVCDAIATSKRFNIYAKSIRRRGLPIALVIQNGQEAIGWGTHVNNFDAIFIGGDTDFKLGAHVRYLVAKAKRLGKWVHMGRVNSLRRIDYARNIGCDSIDGTAVSRFPDVYIPKFLSHLATTPHNLGFNLYLEGEDE